LGLPVMLISLKRGSMREPPSLGAAARSALLILRPWWRVLSKDRLPWPIPPDSARVVIIGGGIGCSVTYHLAKQAWKNVVLRLLYQKMVQ
jgi:hypothetical protein